MPDGKAIRGIGEAWRQDGVKPLEAWIGMLKCAAVAGAFLICGAISAAHGKDFEHADWHVDARFLGCPKVLKSNQALNLTFGAGHGSELAIQRADSGDRFDLIFRGYSDDQKPVMTSDQFVSARSLKIPTTIKWSTIDADTLKKTVFAEEGWYIVYSSDNLEAGAGGYTCTFHYIK